MMQDHPVKGAKAVIALDALGDLIAGLAGSHRVLGPTVRDGAIVYDDIAHVQDLPTGWTDRQDAGRYLLERREDNAVFGFAVGPHSWKQFLHPPIEKLWTARRGDDGFTIESASLETRRFAFIGVRACELHAIAIQDRVFLEGPYRDATYGMRRQDAFIVAVNCGQAGGTCFCVSMGTGPQADAGFDLALTELIDAARHEFLVEAGSQAGGELLERLPHRAASGADLAAAEAVIAGTRNAMGRTLDTGGLKELLQANPTHPRWDDAAERCLACGNCTSVCPTCFTMDFSYLHGGSVRQSGSARYRQWMTHKLASWIDQFGTSGCVGCGRCITWCPVGIDITAEAAAIRASRPPSQGEPHEGA